MTSLFNQPIPDRGRDPSVSAEVEQLYRSYRALVRSVCCSLLRDRAEAEDAVQQTFLSAQRALLNGSSPREAAAWLVAIARNESLTRLRARMREPLSVEIGEHGAAPDAYTATLHRQEANELRDALAELPRRQREAILLRELRGFTSQEVGAALSVTAYAADSLASRARRSLRRRLRGGLASLTPGALLQPLRESAARVGTSLGASAAAKVTAVGVGTLLVAGGALVGPRALGLGHGLRPSGDTRPSAASRPVESDALPDARTFSSRVVRGGWRDAAPDSDRARHGVDKDSFSQQSSGGQGPSSQQSTGNSQTFLGDNNSQGGAKNTSGSGNQQQAESGSGDSQPGAGNVGSSDSGNSQGANGQGD